MAQELTEGLGSRVPNRLRKAIISTYYYFSLQSPTFPSQINERIQAQKKDKIISTLTIITLEGEKFTHHPQQLTWYKSSELCKHKQA